MRLKSICSFFCAIGFLAGPLANGQVVITEFMAANKTTIADEDGAFSDWVELYNSGASPVNLNGWYLTDNANNLTKWRFPATNLAPNSFMLVWASSKNRAVAGAPLHASFSLSADGEYLGLIQPDGQTVASEFAPLFPEQFDNISYGLLNGTNVYFGTPTPGALNGTNSVAFVGDTKFSHARGFYTNAFNLVITTKTTNAVIRYTTNGSPPALTNGIVYSTPIPVSKTSVIRAAAFKTGFQPSNIDTETYLFLNDVIQQSPTGVAPPGWPTSWGLNTVSYGMDPDVVNNPLYSSTIINDLKAIPTISLVMKLGDLFDPSTGIYANSLQSGSAWERPASVELINPDGTEGFQVEAGVRIGGGFSASSIYAKHSFRLFFRSEYGDAKLKYPVFGENAADSFDGFDLATFQNHSWSNNGGNQPTNAIFVRDQFSRDTQLAMGYQAERGTYVHLYINGQYWGIYCPAERPEASYAATYFGGAPEDYDVVKHAGGGNIEATDGDLAAWTCVWQMATNGFSSDAAYQRLEGNNSDGSRNPAYDILVDVDNLIDYQLIVAYAGSYDGPLNISGSGANNWYAIRPRDGSAGFRFWVHDFEHSLINLNENRIGPYSAGNPTNGGGLIKSTSQYIWQQLQANANFRLRVADHVHRHFFNGGLLTPDAAIARFKVRTNQVDRALVGESARWGDETRPALPYTRNADWIPLIDAMLTNYFPQRTGIVLNQLKAKSLYPGATAPVFSQHGGNITNDFLLSITAAGGTIYYTLDGSDPRLPNGAVSPTAQAYGASIILSENVTVKARVLSGVTWSALNEAPFVIIRDFTDLLITEIMYHPPDEGLIDGDEFEFIELKNVAATNLDLSGVRFTNGISYTFPNGTLLGSGQFIVLASNPTEFTNKYPGIYIDGIYTGRLSNSGEFLALVHAAGAPIALLNFSDSAPWPATADGSGFSLVPINPNLNPDPASAINWRASINSGGSPGTDDPTPSIAPILINEILTHTDPPLTDRVELFNPTPNAVNIGNWFLTDERTNPFKYRISAGTMVPANGYVVFSETHFNSNPGSATNFSFDSHGEEVYLYSADAGGNLTGYSHGFSFGAAENPVSFGRYVTSTGENKYPAQSANTFGDPNAGPRVGPIVINEIRYHPIAGDEEFIELKNTSGDAIKFYDPLHSTNVWMLNGIGFSFPPNFEIPAGGLVVITATDPVAFRAHNHVPAQVSVLGPYPGQLQDNGELLQLQRPDKPDTNLDNTITVPYLTVDDVRYSDQSPWPAAASVSGSSLERIDPSAYGDDPINWRARLHGASPGFENDQNAAPFVSAGSTLNLAGADFPLTIQLDGTAIDDGLPSSPATLAVLWNQVNGPGQVVFSPSNQPQAFASFPGIGTYVLRLTANDGALQSSNDVKVVIEHASYASTFVAQGDVWQYLDNGSNQSNVWRALIYDDANWSFGSAQIGYGGNGEATVINGGPAGSRIVTTYLRKKFIVEDAAEIAALTLRLLRDDGGVVYLNDTEIFRSNLPGTTIFYDTLALEVIGVPNETTFYPTNVSPTLLVNGTNILAVEIHQANRTGGDMGFDFELSGTSFGTNQPPRVYAGPDLAIQLPQAATLNGFAQDDGLPITPGICTFGWSKVSGPGDVTFGNSNALATTAQFSSVGVYSLRLIAGDGQLSASTNLTVSVSAATYQSWANFYFSLAELNDPNISGSAADPDTDGRTNQQEFDAGTNPRDAQSVLKMEATRLSAATFIFNFSAVAGKSYSLQVRDGLDAGAWSNMLSIAQAPTNRIMTITNSAPARESRFFRLATP